MPTQTYMRRQPVHSQSKQVLFVNRNWINNHAIDIRRKKATNYINDRREVIAMRVRQAGYESQLPEYIPDAYNAWPGILGGMVAKCESASYSKFRGRLYYGATSLGITIVQWRQAAEQLRAYYKAINSSYEQRWHWMTTQGWKPREISNRWLEWIFGLVPLYQSIYATATSVIDFAIPPEYVRAAHTEWGSKESPGVYYRQAQCRYRMTRAARVSVSNPNTWLAERAGLLNPATIFWDAVPWSFALNMFVNINQLLQQMTDFCGLTFDDYNETVVLDYWESRGGPMYFYRFHSKDQRRAIKSMPVPPRHLQFRVPESKWELIATAAALTTQRYGKIKHLLVGKT